MPFSNIFLNFIFKLLIVVFSVCFVLRAATASVEITWCLRFFVYPLLPRAIAMTNHFPKERAIYTYSVFISEHSMPWLSRAFCVAPVADFFASQIFVAATRTIFSVDILFLKMPRISFFLFIFDLMKFFDSNSCVSVFA